MTGLTAREIFEAADEVVRAAPPSVWDGESLPVPVVEIATAKGVDAAGDRYRAAHLLGHVQLHGEDAVQACDAPPAPVRTLNDQRGRSLDAWTQPEPGDPRDIEWEADIFGGAMLMPPRLLRRELRVRERKADHSAELAELFAVEQADIKPRWAHGFAFSR